MNTRLPLLLLAPLAACGGGGTEAAGTPPNVILICLDTVRSDHLGCYGYTDAPTTPWMDSLAARSTLFMDCSATACWTKPSVPSFLTGTYPLQHGVYRGSARNAAGAFSDTLNEEAETLAEAFQEAGYRTGAFVRNAQLRRGMGFEQGFEDYVDQAGDAREIRWQASDWMARGDDDARPFFLYLHYLDAHWPYPVPDEYATRFADPEAVAEIRSGDWRALRDAVNSGRRTLTPEELAALVGVYDGSLRYLDDQLALLERTLEREGLAENTVICIISDHGEEFCEHGKLGHGHGLYENLLQVPWILHLPGRAPAQVEAPVSLVDLYPTLLAAAGLEVGRAEGVDRLARPDVDRPILAEHLDPGRYHQSWRLGERKTVAILRPQRDQDGTSASRDALAAGGRWEARIEVGESGELRASRLRPAATQDDRPPEYKGLVEAVDDDHLILFGRQVRLDADTELYGELFDPDGGQRELAPGMLVKARGPIVDGVLLAEKVKLYAAGSEVEVELRGDLLVQSDSLVTLAGVTVGLDQRTDVELESDPGDLTRDDVLGVLTGTRAVGERVVNSFDLGRDPAELSPDDGPPAVEPQAQADWLRELLERRRWGAARALGQEELEDLKAIGYADQ